MQTCSIFFVILTDSDSVFEVHLPEGVAGSRPEPAGMRGLIDREDCKHINTEAIVEVFTMKWVGL